MRYCEMLRFSIIALCISISVFLVGCSTAVEPTNITPTTTQTPLPVVVKTEPPLTATAIRSESPSSNKPAEVLESAVENLLHAISFEMTAHEVRAYQAVGADGEALAVYGEFITNYSVIRSPSVKVLGTHAFKFDPQDDFHRYETVAYQEGNKYYTQFFEDSVTSDVKEIDLKRIEPFAGDIYQTLTTYSNQAKFVTESDGIAVYVLEHPKWYQLEGAIGFADLGFLYGQENGEQLVEQYAVDHYPNVETIVFTIYVVVDEQVITRVEVDDSGFMTSLWAEIDRALIAQGAEAEALTQYLIMDENGSEYHFSNYNQVQDFEILK